MADAVLTRSRRSPACKRGDDPVERYLLALIDRAGGHVPLIDELAESDLGSARGTAAIARAALVQLRSKRPDVIAADLRRELAEADWLAAWRLRRMSGDLAGAPWQRIQEVNQARRESGDERYRRERAAG